MKKLLIQISIVAGLILIPYVLAGAPKFQKEITDHQKLENVIETLQKIVDTQNEQQAYIQVLWARTQDLHEQLLKLSGDPGNHEKALYRLEGELNMVDARVAQLERPAADEDAN